MTSRKMHEIPVAAIDEDGIPLAVEEGAVPSSIISPMEQEEIDRRESLLRTIRTVLGALSTDELQATLDRLSGLPDKAFYHKPRRKSGVTEEPDA